MNFCGHIVINHDYYRNGPYAMIIKRISDVNDNILVNCEVSRKILSTYYYNNIDIN